MKKRYITYGLLLSSTVLVLSACAEPANRDDLQENYTSVLVKDDVQKYKDEKKKESEKVERVSFMENPEYAKNLENMILNYNYVADMVHEMYGYTSINDTYLSLYNSLEANMEKTEEAARYISKYNTEKVLKEEEDVLYELKILAINIQENLQNQRNIFNNQKVITDYDSYLMEANDREERLMNQYGRALMKLEEYLADNNMSLQEYFATKNNVAAPSGTSDEKAEKPKADEGKEAAKKEASKDDEAKVDDSSKKETKEEEDPASNIKVNTKKEEE